jgi:hypoxia up-regulated 1
LGGFNFDMKIVELLANRFNKILNSKTKFQNDDVRLHVRPMTRLRLEAVKIKEVLSANPEYPVKIEQLYGDFDLITKITRSDFETECNDLFNRLTIPITKAIESASITLDNITSVELIGGGVRVPKIKKLLEEYFKPSKLEVGQHLNGDEAMALGAAFRAANLSTSFKVRKIGHSDYNNFGISIKLESLSDDSWNKSAEIFPAKSLFSSKIKTVTFPYDKDVICNIFYTDVNILPQGTSATISTFNITGVTKFAQNIDSNYSFPKVHLSFSLENDGVVLLTKAEVTSDFLLSNETIHINNNDTMTNSSNTSSDTNSTLKNEKKNKSKDVLRSSLEIIEDLKSSEPSQWSKLDILESRRRLQHLNEIDENRKMKEESLNQLETYIYKV